jgi:hypothetical protein
MSGSKPNGSRRREHNSHRVLVKTGASIDFLNGSDATLFYTHATLRFALEKLPPKA